MTKPSAIDGEKDRFRAELVLVVAELEEQDPRAAREAVELVENMARKVKIAERSRTSLT